MLKQQFLTLTYAVVKAGFPSVHLLNATWSKISTQAEFYEIKLYLQFSDLRNAHSSLEVAISN